MIKSTYGDFFQEGGVPETQEGAPLDQMQQEPSPEQIAQEFLQAFSQLPPEVQQIVIQQIMQMVQQSQQQQQQ